MTRTHAFAAPDPALIEGATGAWEVVVGVEAHAQILSASKLFSSAPTAYGAAANTQVSFVDAAMPGMLPVANRVCVEQAIRAGFGLQAKINLRSTFDRKNYFYPDLPQGYQISQYSMPIVGEGEILVDLAPGVARKVRIERIHLEQDAGKSLHDLDPDASYVDLNRAGVALLEIVSRPDLRSAEETGACLRKLRLILRTLDVCDGNMEEGSLRADINVSVRREGEDFGTRCEIKNVNSIRFAQAAVEHEARRQIALIEDGRTVMQETRLFDPRTGATRAMRTKEEAHDYRYFPDPDLPPLIIDPAWVDRIAASLPELPDAKKARFIADYGLTEYDSSVLCAEPGAARYFERVARGRDGKQAANWVVNELFGRLNREGLDIARSPIAPDQLGGILDLVASGTISGAIARALFDILWREGGDPAAVVEARNMRQITDSNAIERVIDRVIADNGDKTEKAKEKPNLAGWFVGQVMRATGGKADPKTVNELVRKKLGLQGIDS